MTLVDVASITAHPGYTYSFANPMYQDDFAILTLAEVVASTNFKDKDKIIAMAIQNLVTTKMG